MTSPTQCNKLLPNRSGTLVITQVSILQCYSKAGLLFVDVCGETTWMLMSCQICCWWVIWGSAFWGLRGHVWRANLTIIACIWLINHTFPSIHYKINNISISGSIQVWPKGTKNRQITCGLWKHMQQSCPLNNPWDLCKITPLSRSISDNHSGTTTDKHCN